MKLCETRLARIFEQECDCCSNSGSINTVEIKTENGGTSPADNYCVIVTERWAVDSGEELRKLADEVDKLLKDSAP
jgi:hypothetical protein